VTRLTLVAIALSCVAAGAVDSAAQSLGDVARKEAERRGSAPQAGKTYTNGNLTPDFTKPAPPAAVEVEAEPGPGEKPDPAKAAPAKTDAEKAGAESVEGSVDVASDPAEAEKWGVTPRDQQTSSQSDDQKEEYWRTTAALLKAKLAEVNQRLEELRVTLAATPKGAPGSEREIVERAFEKAQASQKNTNQDWVRFEARARQRGIPMDWIR
jgi:hypothetical protein